MSDTACSICSQPDHGETWRCETCGATFECPSAFLTMPTGVVEITAHRARPVIGLSVDGNPMYGDEVTCGPVLPASEARVSKTQRGFAIAHAQQRRSQLRLIGQAAGRDVARLPDGEVVLTEPLTEGQP